MKNAMFRAALGLATALAAASPSMAADTGGCESFAFPLTTELQWMKQVDAEAVASGAKLAAPPAKAMIVTLQPTADIAFPVTPKKAKEGDGSNGAFVSFDTLGGHGVYQVSLSVKGWADLVQDGAALKSVAHSGKSDCDGLRKSVRFDVKDGPVTLQLTGVAADTIRVIVRKAD